MPMFKNSGRIPTFKKIGAQFQCLNKRGRIPMLGRTRSE